MAYLLMPGVADAASNRLFAIEGHGYGHGVGMGQYGAEGFAAHGADYKAVLAHYYPGTQLAEVSPTARVRVLLASPSAAVVVSSVTALRVVDETGKSATLPAGRYLIDRRLVLEKDGRYITAVAPVRVVPTVAPLTLNGRPYRGSLLLYTDPAGVSVVNELPIDSYVQGVLAWEMPAGWHQEALRAQAVAARSYALASLSPSRTYDVYPDQRSQMYGGLRAERLASNRAVVATAGEVLVWNGRVASTYFSSSTGGRTANVGDVWPGGRAAPYLVSVPDPYDSRSPNHHWGPYLMSARTLSTRLGIGSIHEASVIADSSGRVRFVQLGAADGRHQISGAAAARALGLRSTWFTIRAADSQSSVRSSTNTDGTSTIQAQIPHKTLEIDSQRRTPIAAPAERGSSSQGVPAIWLVSVALAFAATGILLVKTHRHPVGGALQSSTDLSFQERLYLFTTFAAVAAVITIGLPRADSTGSHAVRQAVGSGSGLSERKASNERPAMPTPAETTPPTLPRLPSVAAGSSHLLWQKALQPTSDAKGGMSTAPTVAVPPADAAGGWRRAQEDAPSLPAARLEIRDVQVTSLTSSSVSVMWRTNLPATGQGARGLAMSPRIWTEAVASSLEHETVFTGLGSGTPYHLWLLAHDEFQQTAMADLIVVTPTNDATQATVEGDTITVNGEPTFPVMLWASCASDLGSKLAQGINVFMGNGCGSDADLVNALGGRGYAVVNSASADQEGPGILGWYYPDEWDAHLDGSVKREELNANVIAAKAGRISFLTLTNHFYSRASALPQGKGMYPTLYSIPDVIGFDLYPLQVWCRPAFGDVSDAQAELHAASGGKPTFQWIEVAGMEHPCNAYPELNPTVATVRAETWLAIAGGADGIGYFPNSWSPEIGDEISRTSWQIKELAPALLGVPASTTSDTPAVRVAARELNGALYIIAVNTSKSVVSANIHLPTLGERTAEVFGEERSVTARGESFLDQFPPLAVHIYVAPPANWPGTPMEQSLQSQQGDSSPAFDQQGHYPRVG